MGGLATLVEQARKSLENVGVLKTMLCGGGRQGVLLSSCVLA